MNEADSGALYIAHAKCSGSGDTVTDARRVSGLCFPIFSRFPFSPQYNARMISLGFVAATACCEVLCYEAAWRRGNGTRRSVEREDKF